jgi:two-component system, NtrC family, response regulator PilR
MTNAIERILVVDDEKEFVNTIKRHLTREGFCLDAASNGETACRKMGEKAIGEGRYDLVITDLVMPYMGGLELFQWIKLNCPDTSVIVLTGSGNTERILPLIRPELDCLAQKPMTPGLMMALLGDIREKRSSRREFLGNNTIDNGLKDKVELF